MPKVDTLLLDLKISRPGLWFPTLWIYLVPFGDQVDYWKTFPFWIGLFFVTFPLNYLVYGLNDFNDIKADARNNRKGNYLFGAKATKEELRSVPHKIMAINTPFIVLFTYLSGIKMLLLLVLMIVVNIGYNFKPLRLKERPPFEILIQVGYVLTAFFATELNGLNCLPWQTVVYLSLFAFQAHMAGEIMDIEPDRATGKRTTASILGRKKAKVLMLLLLVLEAFLLWFWFGDLVLSGFLGLFSIWLLLDTFVIFKNRPYSQGQMKLFGIAINLSAILSMAWVLHSGKLLSVL